MRAFPRRLRLGRRYETHTHLLHLLTIGPRSIRLFGMHDGGKGTGHQYAIHHHRDYFDACAYACCDNDRDPDRPPLLGPLPANHAVDEEEEHSTHNSSDESRFFTAGIQSQGLT